MKYGPNTMEWIGYYGGDETHSLSAWTSTDRSMTEEKRKRRAKLLSTLAINGHHTPFEKSVIHVLVTTEIASHIHLIKHRIGVSVNGESARYKELLEDKGYIPQDWSRIEQLHFESHLDLCFERYHACIKRLEAAGVDRKRAKESARFYLCYGTQITADVLWNWRSFWHTLTLRYHEAAQTEVQEILFKTLDHVHKLEGSPFGETLDCFNLTRNGVLRGPFTKKEFRFIPDYPS